MPMKKNKKRSGMVLYTACVVLVVLAVHFTLLFAFDIVLPTYVPVIAVVFLTSGLGFAMYKKVSVKAHIALRGLLGKALEESDDPWIQSELKSREIRRMTPAYPYIYSFMREGETVVFDFALYHRVPEIYPYSYLHEARLRADAGLTNEAACAFLEDVYRTSRRKKRFLFAGARFSETCLTLFVHFHMNDTLRFRKELNALYIKHRLTEESGENTDDEEFATYYEELAPPDKELHRLLNQRISGYFVHAGYDEAQPLDMYYLLVFNGGEYFGDVEAADKVDHKVDHAGEVDESGDKGEAPAPADIPGALKYLEQYGFEVDYAAGRLLLVRKETRPGLQRLNANTDVLVDGQQQYGYVYMFCDNERQFFDVYFMEENNNV